MKQAQAARVTIDTASSSFLPLLADRNPDAPLAWRGGQPVSARQFLADVARLAPVLPAEGPAVNLCLDRYAFAVSLGAALVRGHASLLPPDARPDTLARLTETGGPHLFALTDDTQLDTPGMRRLPVEAVPGPAGDAPVPVIDGGRHAASLLTSGSTGVPQPHAKAWRTLVGDVEVAVERLCRVLQRPTLEGLTLVATVPVQHSYGLESSVLLAMLGGAAFETGRPFFPADVAKALASVPRPRALVTTPFHLKTLLLSGIELPSVDLILSATAPLSPQLALQAEQALGGVLLEIYGSTESGQVATRRTTDSEIWETFGEIRVHAEPGEGDGPERFIFSGDFIPEPTPMADVLELLDARRFRLFGRANDLIHVAGRRSSLAHLNYHLNSIAGVEDGAFWLPDEVADGVVRPVAFVVAPTLSATDIIAALRQRLEPVFVPRRVVQVKAFPREGTGKLTVRALREFALAQLADDQTPVQMAHTVPVDHPAFAGHFPGQPLVPGALLLAEVMEVVRRVPALSARLGPSPTLAAAKFLAPVRPGSTLSIELQPEAGTGRGVRFDVRCDGVVAVTGRWTAVPESAQ
ncbi:AMP-binding protein [Variovorax sp. EBFNA2]|uniref:AMP-binding protein n=1 Tax=Variovorax sp. EBFNA2 TaxID=3342097 RepID=UPI0029C0A03B|nr:AMP-binding protein [Variovorax boronicumulans]WPG34916.1 AMP-binding protein [Variovorax boronicumulans]